MAIKLIDKVNMLCVQNDDEQWLFVVSDDKPVANVERAPLRPLRDEIRREGHTCEIRVVKSKAKETEQL